jgi:hypothetical protein
MPSGKTGAAARRRMAEAGEPCAAGAVEECARDEDGLPGTVPALEPATLPDRPLTAAGAACFVAKEIG